MSDELRDLHARLTDVSIEVGRQGEQLNGLNKRMDGMSVQVTEIHTHLLGEQSKQSQWSRKVIWLVVVGLLSAAGLGVGVKALTPPAVAAQTIVAPNK